MQPKHPDEGSLVDRCIRALCKASGFADPDRMVQRDLVFLCDHIEAKTGVVISLSTIKRLINGQFSRLPQIATLDALAQTLGYAHWQGFVAAAAEESAADLPRPAASRSRGTRRLRWLLPAAALLCVALASLAVMRMGRHRIAGASTARFSAAKVTGNDLPNTVVFTYDVEGVTADSFFIQQSWDRNRRVRIDKHAHTLTDIYFEPGYHVAKLIANDQIIKTVDVHIPTDRWVYYAQKALGANPEYITASDALRLTHADLVRSNVDIQPGNLYVMVNFPTKLEHPSNNFRLRFRVRVDDTNHDPCPFVEGEVFCQRYFMYYKNTLPGCTSEAVAQFGENVLNGKTYDLSALGSDVRTWQDVEVIVRNKTVRISLNHRPAFAATYKESCGLVTGVGIISNGLCSVDSVVVE